MLEGILLRKRLCPRSNPNNLVRLPMLVGIKPPRRRKLRLMSVTDESPLQDTPLHAHTPSYSGKPSRQLQPYNGPLSLLEGLRAETKSHMTLSIKSKLIVNYISCIILTRKLPCAFLYAVVGCIVGDTTKHHKQKHAIYDISFQWCIHLIFFNLIQYNSKYIIYND